MSSSLGGNLSKRVIQNNIIKGSSTLGLEPFSEYITSRIFKDFSGISEVILYDIESSDKYYNISTFCKAVSICKIYPKKLYKFYDYIENDYTIESNLDILEVYISLGLSEDYIYRLLMMDSLTGNIDRHWNNIDIYVDDNGILNNGPALDFGASLLSSFNETGINQYSKIGYDITVTLYDLHKDQFKYLIKRLGKRKVFNFTLTDLILNVNKSFKEIDSKVPNNKFFTKQRKQMMINYLINRYEVYIKPLTI